MLFQPKLDLSWVFIYNSINFNSIRVEFRLLYNCFWTKNLPALEQISSGLKLFLLLFYFTGNGSELTETQMKRLILQPKYNCEDELQHCFNSCNLLLSMFEPMLGDDTTLT